MARKKSPPAALPPDAHTSTSSVGNDSAYNRHKDAARARQAELSLAGRDIGEIPPVANPTRRAAAERSLRVFCDTYLKATFTLPWSADHIRVLGRADEVVLNGGLFAVAMPRAMGKTSIAEAACVFATLYGHRRFVVLIGSDKDAAERMLESIKSELVGNELLAEDFPEVCYPITRLDGIANRCKGQLAAGVPTQMQWKSDRIVLPTVVGSKASGSILRVAGLTGGIRGMKQKLISGESIRPDLVIPDDPQTDDSAWSPSQCATRERILAGAVLGLAGPNKKISGIMPCTVIRTGDMADNILDRTKHPEWHGERTKLVYSFPTNERLWEEYASIRAEEMRRGSDGREATEFYRQHRVEMDAGAVVAWAERHLPDELSAIQYAMNLKLRDEAAFYAEYQNEPKDEQANSDDLTADQIAEKVNGMNRGVVAVASNHVTAFIDVQASLLYYTVAAWSDDFTGQVLDYGTYPPQPRQHFTLRDATHTLQSMFPTMGLEGQINAGLTRLVAELCGRPWQRGDGAQLRIERLLIDANYGESTDTVYQYCLTSPFSSVVIPSHGKGISASGIPMNERVKQTGDRVGNNWYIPNVAGKRAVRHVIYDTNFWKSFAMARLAVALADRGCLSLFGREAREHRLFAEHLTAEYSVQTTGRGRTLREWKSRPSKPDNHWLDCVVGSAVAASIQGVGLNLAENGQQQKQTAKRRRTLGEAMAAKPGIRKLS